MSGNRGGVPGYVVLFVVINLIFWLYLAFDLSGRHLCNDDLAAIDMGCTDAHAVATPMTTAQ
ncbi:MAG TPA: hypothetical protein VHA37_01865 [Candidatus Saccharimonadales bacterium]|nr:hypothetical protein [Candidatus Saccharimonadales bacterium]